MNIILFVITVNVIIICITAIICKNLIIKFQREMINGKVLKDSPYGISREEAKSGRIGYCITKNGKVLYTATDTATVYNDINSCIKEINIFEKLEGYKLTSLN